MSQHTHQYPGRKPSKPGGCASDDDRAQQPNPPGDDCDPLPTTTPPELPEPTKCPPPEDCRCKEPPAVGPNCLEDLIAQQMKKGAVAEKAKAFKTELDALLAQAKAATAAYTTANFETLVKEWVRQDAVIAELVRTLVCTVPCWRCVIECHVCPLLNDVHYAERRLYGDWKLYGEVWDLHDLRYWHSRDLAAKQRRLARISAVLGVWCSSKETIKDIIEKRLDANNKLIGTVSTSLGSDPSKAVYDVFMKLVPMHLAIAPPEGSAWTTKIAEEYTDVCTCYEGHPDACCGPDVGEPSLRQRLVGPQPYLIDPNDYFRVICCLVKNRYAPAKDAVTEAETAWQAVDERIKALETQIPKWLDPKTFETTAKGAIPCTIDCDCYDPSTKPCDESPAQAH